MKVEQFKAWMESQSMNPKPIKDCICRCGNVERSLNVNLDREFRRDGGKKLLQRMKYTANDERAKKPIPTGFVFKEGANVRLRLTDLRSATKKYFLFCETRDDDKNG